MPPRHMQNSLGCLCLRVQTGIPYRPERKTSPLYYPNPSLGCGQPAPPMQCWRLRYTLLKQEGNDFSHRETCPQFGSAGNQHCIDWGCGGAVRRGWRGRFFRSGRTRLRWCCTAIFMCVLCGAWMRLFLFGTTTSNNTGGKLDGYTALSRDPMHASLPGTLPPTTGPAGTTQLRETGRP